MDQFASRKFIFAIVAVLLGFMLVVAGRVGAEAWFTFTEVIGGAYIAGNVTEKLAEKLGQ